MTVPYGQSKMDYAHFGRTGMKVSRLALGMGLRGQADEAVAQYLVEYAIDQGVNLIDCANIYGSMSNRVTISTFWSDRPPSTET